MSLRKHLKLGLFHAYLFLLALALDLTSNCRQVIDKSYKLIQEEAFMIYYIMLQTSEFFVYGDFSPNIMSEVSAKCSGIM